METMGEIEAAGKFNGQADLCPSGMPEQTRAAASRALADPAGSGHSTHPSPPYPPSHPPTTALPRELALLRM